MQHGERLADTSCVPWLRTSSPYDITITLECPLSQVPSLGEANALSALADRFADLATFNSFLQPISLIATSAPSNNV